MQLVKFLIMAREGDLLEAKAAVAFKSLKLTKQK